MALLSLVTGWQRELTASNSRFLACQFHEFGDQSTDVHGFRQRTPSGGSRLSSANIQFLLWNM
jgi:hypothetical protein